MQSDIVQPVIALPKLDPRIYSEIANLVASYGPSVKWLFDKVVAGAIVLSICLTIFFIVATIYCVERLKIIRKKEKEKVDMKIEPAFEPTSQKGDKVLASKWHKIMANLNSQNENDWKQAILEADTILLDILTGLGYQGDGVGEKLKRVQPGEFKNIDDAWEAHKIRNQIAHNAGFVVDHSMALQVIHRYRRVFEEFYYI